MMPELVTQARTAGVECARELEGLDETRAARKALEILQRHGLTGWTVPKRFGGNDTRGASPDERVSVRVLCAIRDELAWHSGFADVMFVMQGLGSYPLAIGGSARLRAELLPMVARADAIAAFALTEPDAGSSLGEVATRAERVAHGWRLNGHKTFISNAGLASFYTVLARTSEHKEGKANDAASTSLSMFCVPADAHGVSIERFEVMAPHPIGDVRFHDVDIPADHLIGEEGRGLDVALKTLSVFRTSVAAAANGFARRAFDESRARLKSRRQFGKELASFQGLRFDLAEMDVRLRAAQLLVAEAADAVDNDRPAAMEVARAKLFATENASWVCDRAVQHFGGLGVKRGTTVERLFREVRALRIYEGTSEIQKLVLAKEILDGDRH